MFATAPKGEEGCGCHRRFRSELWPPPQVMVIAVEQLYKVNPELANYMRRASRISKLSLD